MDGSFITLAIVICFGVLCYLTSIWEIKQIYKTIDQKSLMIYWGILLACICLFIISYGIIGATYFLGSTLISFKATMFILFFGALFVVLVTNASRRTYSTLFTIKNMLKIKIKSSETMNAKLQQKSKALAKANVNIAELYSTLEETKEKLENNEKSLTKQNEGLTKANNALASANARMAELYLNLEDAKAEIEKNKSELEVVNNELNHINLAARTINSTLDLDSILHTFLGIINHIIEQVEAITIHVVDKKTNQLIFYQIYSYSNEIKNSAAQQLSSLNIDKDSMFYQVVNHKRSYSYSVSEKKELSEVDNKIVEILGYKSVMCFPLETRGYIIGCLCCYSFKNAIEANRKKIDFLHNHMLQAAIAINNARVYEDLKNTKIKLAETEKITALTNTFKKFVPDQFLNRIAKHGIDNINLGAAENVLLSILFLDIRSYTSLSENLEATTLHEFLNGFFTHMCKSVYKNSGFVDKFIGDAIMALFDSDAEKHKNSAQLALLAAIDMQKDLAKFNQEYASKIGRDIEIGVGIHTGPVLLGTVGAENRMESTVLGDSVNISSRLENLNKQYLTKIIISGDTYTQLNDQEKELTRSLGFVQIRGRAKELRIIEVFAADEADIIEKKLATKPFLEKAVVHATNREWGIAREQLQQALQIFPEDETVKLLLENVRNK